MARLLATAALLGGLLPLTGANADVGEPAPDFSCGKWVNVAGKDAPTPQSLKGKLVLLEFWFST